MDISIGIVGLPNTGKSTLFNALTKKEVPSENYPFCTIDPSVGVVPVLDERLEKLAEISRSAKAIPSVVEFVDIAGLVKGASDGEGLGNAFLSHIREVNVIAHMVRCFTDDSIIHVDGDIDPKRDIGVIETELILADVQIIERRLKKIEKDVKRHDKNAVAEKSLLSGVLSVLNGGERADRAGVEERERRQLNALGLLTIKPMFYIANAGVDAADDAPHVTAVRKHAERTGSSVVVLSAHTEHELAQISHQDAQALRNEMSLSGGGIAAVIQVAYSALNLISYFTTGEKETRAWAVPSGSTAPAAARAIHTDFEKNFIRAEVVSYENFVRVGSYAAVREAGALHLEGKGYVVQDGDIIVFRTG